MDLLENGIPLSLLMDLAWGPCSEELMQTETAASREPAA